jgi:hypothetical protein
MEVDGREDEGKFIGWELMGIVAGSGDRAFSNTTYAL